MDRCVCVCEKMDRKICLLVVINRHLFLRNIMATQKEKQQMVSDLLHTKIKL